MEPPPRKAYPSDGTDDEWAFAALHLTLMRADDPTAATLDSRTLRSTP